MQGNTVNHKEWYIPAAFIICFAWQCWHFPYFILDFFTPEDQSLFDQLSAQMIRNDVTPNLPGLFGGFADIVDWFTLIALPILLVFGLFTVERARMEFEHWRPVDRSQSNQIVYGSLRTYLEALQNPSQFRQLKPSFHQYMEY